MVAGGPSRSRSVQEKYFATSPETSSEDLIGPGWSRKTSPIDQRDVTCDQPRLLFPTRDFPPDDQSIQWSDCV